MLKAMNRDPQSHKGENGKVCVIGGSRFMHGAPIMAALAAEAAGVDLVYLFVPPAHEDVAKQASLNFQVRTFTEQELMPADTGLILQQLASMDCAVIGPGLSREAATLAAIRQIITGAPCPVILDATALQPDTLQWITGKTTVLTPHLGELERMGVEEGNIARTAQESGAVILLKGQIDSVTGPDGETHETLGGNAGLTVGGTGDALAGLTAGLLSLRLSPVEAAIRASMIIKRAGDLLAESQGFSYTARDVIELIPIALHELSDPA
jgi:NAD(P)H-hydrate epimerase